MANPASPFQPAIDELEKDLADLERQGNALLSAINVLRGKAGLPHLPDGGGNGSAKNAAPGTAADAGSATTPVQIRPDTFFGKKMGTAAREYLTMRRAAGGDGPAKPREIFDAMKSGGFQFETKDDTVAMISLRNMLRKRTEMFQRLPNNTYGLRAWYPDAKPRKQNASEGERPEENIADDEEDKPARPKSTSAAA